LEDLGLRQRAGGGQPHLRHAHAHRHSGVGVGVGDSGSWHRRRSAGWRSGCSESGSIGRMAGGWLRKDGFGRIASAAGSGSAGRGRGRSALPERPGRGQSRAEKTRVGGRAGREGARPGVWPSASGMQGGYGGTMMEHVLGQHICVAAIANAERQCASDQISICKTWPAVAVFFTHRI
jgi:hypothetical protein